MSTLGPSSLVWLVMACTLSLLIAAAAMFAQRLIGPAFPHRAIWGAALFVALGVTVALPLRVSEEPGRPASLEGWRETPTLIVPPSASPLVRVWSALRAAPSRAGDAIADAASASARAIQRAVPGFPSSSLPLAWLLASGTLLVILAASYARQRRLLAASRTARIAGVPVHVCGSTGPAVVGIVDPAILVPQWLLARTPEEQRLVILHECSHVRARDPLLLLLGCVAVALMPWNPAAWWMLARLRLAIELDCDARVLAAGVSARGYGALLIDLSASPAPSIPLGAPAFSFRASHLERRLRTMTARPARFPMLRASAALVVVASTLLAACGAELPTSAEVQRMDVAAAESRLVRAMPLDSTRTVYVVDGYKMTAEQARGIQGDSIAAIEIRKAYGNTNEIRIATRKTPLMIEVRDSLPPKTAGLLLRKTESAKTTGSPLIFLDGRRISQAEMDAVRPERIASVEVAKGERAIAELGPDGANGVIRITTKK